MAILVAMSIWIYPQITVAEGFSGADLLEWGPKNQRFYFQVSVSMAGVIAAQRDPEQAGCISRWHDEQRAKDYSPLLATVRKYPTYHPQGVIFGYLSKACGEL